MYPGKWGLQKPDAPAVIHGVSGQSISHGELNARSNKLAHLLRERGLAPGDHVALFMENNLRYFEIVWAALRSGLYLTTVNRYLTDEEAAYIIDNCEAQACISSVYLADVARQLPALAPNCHNWLVVDGPLEGFEAYEDAIEPCSPSNLPSEPAGQFMLYSSGTTGRPKGIFRPAHSHQISDDAGPVGALQRELWGFDDKTVYLSPAPLYHSAPISFCTAALALGGTVVMMPRFDETGVLKAIQDYRITHSQWVPTMFTRMLKLPAEARAGFDLSSHKVAIHAAAPCPAGIKRQMFDWWGPIIYEYYGGTELNGFTHCGPEAWLAHPGTVGQAIIGKIHICDESGDELPNGEPGIVYFELPELPFSYHKDPEKTKDAQHPQHANWSALGDVGYVDDDGFLYLTDRATFMIISGGVNIYPQEIEDVLIMHPSVADVAVVGAPNEEMGEEVKAVVQVAPGRKADDALAEELLTYAREHLAHYKCPRSVDFLDELPRLPTGKLYKRLLKDKYWGKSGSRIV